MLISGSKFRSIAERDSLSWRAYLTVSGSNAGRAVFGFSGENNTTCFTFQDGKIFDPENRFFAGYDAGVEIEMISGDISNTKYNYYYGKNPYCFAGVKPDYKVQNFFVQTTGCSLNTNVWIYGDSFDFNLDLPTGFEVSGAITGKLTSVDSDYNFKIFSGEVEPTSGNFEISGFDTGNRNDAAITLSTTGDPSGITAFSTYPIRLILNTNFGVIDQTFRSKAFPKEPLDVDLFLQDVKSRDGQVSGFSQPDAEYDLSYRLSKKHFRDQLTGAKSRPLNISLQYSGGKTGDFYRVSGVQVTSPGSGYTSAPIPFVFGHSHSKPPRGQHDAASGESLMSFSIAGATMTHSGKNYAANFPVIVSGGGGAGASMSGLIGDSAEATVSGKVTGVKLMNAGSGYSEAPTLIFQGTTGAGGEMASGEAIFKSGYITGVRLKNSGIYHLHQPYFSGFFGGEGAGADASLSLTSYTKTFTGVWDLKTGYTTETLSSYRTDGNLSGLRFDNKVSIFENFGYYWKDLRDACQINSGTVHLAYSFMNSGTDVFDSANYTGTKSTTIQDHYWSSRGYPIQTSTSEFTGEIGSAFGEWKELIENAFTGVTVDFKNLGFEGASAAAYSSPWPVYDPIYDCTECGEPQILGYTLRTGAYYFYDRAFVSGAAYNIGDFRIGVVDSMQAHNGGHLAYAYLPMSYANFLRSSETGSHFGDLIFDSKDPWSVDDKDEEADACYGWGCAAGYSIKLTAVHEIGHALGLGHADPNDLWAGESVMSPYVHSTQRFKADFPNGMKASALDKASIKRLYSTGDDGGLYDYSNLNNMYVNIDPVYITGESLKIVVDHDVYNTVEIGATTSSSQGLPTSLNSFTGVGSTGLFKKYIDVFGVPVLATTGVTLAKMSHAANVLAEYLDNNRDGVPDNQSVINKMTSNKSALLITANQTEYDAKVKPHNSVWNNAGFNTYNIHASEIVPNWAVGNFDYSLEKVLHLITSGGYASAYTSLFGLESGTRLADLMDVARGGHFKTIPADNTYSNGPANGRYPSGAWFHSTDTGCDYACQINQYIYWGITTIAGTQSSRCSNITGEWEPCPKSGMVQTDTGLYNLLTQSVYTFPTTTPSGNYQGPNKHLRYESKYPDNEKISVSLQVTGRQNSSAMETLTGVPAELLGITGAISGAESTTGQYPFPEAIMSDLRERGYGRRACCDDNNHRAITLQPYTGEL